MHHTATRPARPITLAPLPCATALALLLTAPTAPAAEEAEPRKGFEQQLEEITRRAEHSRKRGTCTAQAEAVLSAVQKIRPMRAGPARRTRRASLEELDRDLRKCEITRQLKGKRLLHIIGTTSEQGQEVDVFASGETDLSGAFDGVTGVTVATAEGEQRPAAGTGDDARKKAGDRNGAPRTGTGRSTFVFTRAEG